LAGKMLFFTGCRPKKQRFSDARVYFAPP